VNLSKVVAIDGPSGSGKSTIAKMLAQELNLLFIDTGAMYRALALYLSAQTVNPDEPQKIQKLLKGLRFNYCPSPGVLVELETENYTKKIRSPEASLLASQYSKSQVVRDYLVAFQRSLVAQKTCVMEGRDIGTVVFPDAFCKIYFTASESVRALRRFNELKEKGDFSQSYEEVLRDVIERDHNDMNRPIAPLKKAEDAILVDVGNMVLEEVLARATEIVEQKAKVAGIKL
jgi:cytidylate kinase